MKVLQKGNLIPLRIVYSTIELLHSGRSLELGCGLGRNAIYLMQKGCTDDAVDLSEQSLQWAAERAKENNLTVNLIHKNIFDMKVKVETYDIVYDSGCFHHIASHRRMDYVHLVQKALKPGGYFAITCFVQGGELGGADISDEVFGMVGLWTTLFRKKCDSCTKTLTT
ncbi:class I SAM-dependent methyltransferase [Sporosarcina sp. FSL K6-1508]|uniref:class I SAM-dependent methyltransferase n=1 Tax=Sporosarcina sp. FSL K6-1508 TaxID=2921553 RepID=UPI0030F9C111